MLRPVFLLTMMLVGAGCASSKLAPDVASQLNDANVAAAFYMEGKKISYDELVYKVLWNENRSQESVFEGAWDIDRDVTATLSTGLQTAGMHARAVHDVLDAAHYPAFEQAILNTRGSDGMNVPMSMSSELRQAFLDAGVEYVLLLRAAHYQAQKVSGFRPQFSVPSVLMVYDVRSGEQHYDGLFLMGGAIAVDESPREVELNDLAKLKAATHQWVETAGATQVPKTLGLTIE